MKIVLTGGAGFIGSCYLKKLNDMGLDHVYVVDQVDNETQFSNIKSKTYKDYISSYKFLEHIETAKFDDVDAIIHLGACTDTTERDEAFLKKTNLNYTITLAEWALSKNKIFHYASSASVYGDGKSGYSDDVSEMRKFHPLNLYAKSKYNFDKWAIEKNVLDQMAGFRFFNVFGPNEYHKGHMRSMVSKAYDQIQETGEVKLFASSREGYGDGSEERDFVYVKDVCDVMAFFLENPKKAGLFNLGTGKARSFKDLVTSVFKALDQEPKIAYIPMPESLKRQYQYFTQAELKHLRSAGYAKPFLELEDSISDYVKNYLSKENSHL